MSRKKERTMARVASELASAIRAGDVAGIDRSQRQLGRLERTGHRRRREPS
jgi:hypothetical protein